MYRNGKLDSLGAQHCQKYALHQKKGSNKSCSVMNFIQKSPQAYMSYLPHEWSWVTPKISTFEIL